MNEIDRIKDQLQRSFSGDAWHGPAVMELLKDITAGKAIAKPVPGGHSIWEIALHISVWEHVVSRRLNGEKYEPTTEEDWPSIADTTSESWKKTIAAVESAHNALLNDVSNLTDSDLTKTVAGKSYSVYFLLHGIVQHNIYHAGQIALLRK
jgi:uncharacterized damage-inducible protein DinB